MLANRRRTMFLEILFCFVLRILIQFVDNVLMNGTLAFCRRVEIVTVHAGLQCALVAVKGCAPGILRVRSIPPGTVLHTIFRSSYSNVASCVSVMLALLARCT